MISQTIRKHVFAAAAAVILAGGVQAATIGAWGWMQVTPPGASFSALMPGAPEHTSTPVATPAGNIQMHSYMVDSGRYTYAVFIGDLPFTPLSVRQTLDNVRDGNARGGRVVEEKDFTFNGHPGRSVTIEKEGAYLFNRIFMVNNRVYQVMFGMRKSDEVPESANKFITSFRLVD